MTPTRPSMRRLLIGLAMCLAFVLMASVFVPMRSGADEWAGFMQPPLPASVDPHEGLRLIGELEHARYVVRAYATDGGPRYTVYDAADGSEIAALLSAERVAELFPELPILDAEFRRPGEAGPMQLMHADTAREWPRR